MDQRRKRASDAGGLPGLERAVARAGAIGSLIRETDWSATPLGPLEAWPRSLANYVAMILELPSPSIIFWGPEQTQIYNEGYAAIMGPRHPLYFGAPYRECWPETYPVIYPWMREVLKDGTVKQVDRIHVTLTRYGFDEDAYFTFTFSPLRDDDGNIAGILQPVVEVTDSVLSERRSQTLHALAPKAVSVDAARDAIEALSASPDDVPFALIYLWDERAQKLALAARTDNLAACGQHLGAFTDSVQRVYASNAALEIDGVDRMLGGAKIGPWPEATRSALILPVGRPASDAPAGAVVFGISPRLRFDEQYRSFLELASGQVTRAIADAQALREVRKRAEALAELDRAKTTFFSNVSHELRTPLTLILGPTEDALSAPDRAIRGAELESVHRNVLRLLKLVNALLDFSRIEAGRAQAVREPADVATFTADIASGFRAAIERGGVQLEVDCPPLPEPVHIDREMWEKIVLNLLSNAFKFTFEGTIRVALRRAGEKVELEVADTGVGIPEQELPRLFERFHRVEGTRSRTQEGTGIGLALVHSLVELHGGSIAVQSVEHQGTTFTVSIPATAPLSERHSPAAQTLASTATRAETFVAEAMRWLPDGVDEQPTALSDDLASPGEVTLENARILIVDDNADMRAYLSRLLGRHWIVMAAVDGAQALESIREHPPDLVITDIMMPMLDGFELIEALHADPATADIPVIVVSARAGDEAAAEGIKAGADDYLVKPFSARELVARVGSQLALARSHRERAKLLEREQEARKEAELQKQHLTSLFMDAPAPIVILRGRELILELVNRHACRVWGRRYEEVIGRPLLEALPELRGQVFEELLLGVLETGEPYVGREAVASLARAGNEELDDVYLSFVYSPLRNVDGQVDGVLVMAFDVTDQVRARERVYELRDRAESAGRAKDEFLAMLGHELRNPLAPIITALELMRLRGDSAFEKERAVIERQAKQLIGLVNDLLDISRITRGKITLRRSPVEIAGVVEHAIEMASPLLEQRQHHLEVSVPATGLVVDGDENRLAQVVANLLSNAAKYTEPGGQVAVSASRASDEITLKVADNGIGIDAELLPKVFDMFAQIRQTSDRSQGGLGLGLAIVRNLVLLHGGRVSVHSDGPGCGSEFTVRLPIASRLPAPVADREHPAPRKSLNRRRRVLVVDDNEDGAEALGEYLRELGYNARVAYDGPAALHVAEEFVPDAVLLDIGLPAMDGYELAWRLREQLNFQSVCLIAVTGYGQASERERTAAAGFDAHLVKPIDLAALAETLQQLQPD